MRPVRVAVAGSVDDGKSTLLGRLMFDSQKVFRDEVDAVRKASVSPLSGVNLAFFTDGLISERRDGITIDVAWRHLTLGTKRLLLADVPGHAELVRNMATGASTADAALLLVDAERGLQPQTRRHLIMLRGLGVKRIGVCINKLDAVGFAQSVVARLETELGGLELIPVSALHGDNIVQRSDRMPWHSGPTVSEWLQALDPIAPPTHTRAVVQLGSDDGGWTSLHLLSGTVSVGDELTAWPEGSRCRVVECSPHGVGRVGLEPAQPRGVLLTSTSSPARVATSVEAIVTWLGPKVAAEGLRLELLQHGRRTPARLGATDPLLAGDVARVRLELEGATWFDRWEDSPVTGSCLLVDGDGQTVAGGRFT